MQRKNKRGTLRYKRVHPPLLAKRQFMTFPSLVLALLGFAFVCGCLGSMQNDKMLEAEVKQNLHAIQLALERYYTDKGRYPMYLYGGDSQLNIGTVNYYNPAGRTGATYWDQPLRIPYDAFAMAGDGRDYTDASWDELAAGNAQEAFGDPLQYEGYLPNYPANPFMAGQASRRFGLDALQAGETAYACYGGREGNLMFNLGPFGELPQLKLTAGGSNDNRLDFPGSFYYHPRWKDKKTNAGHLKAAQADNAGSWGPIDVKDACKGLLDDSAEVKSDSVEGYDLVAFGSVKTKGQDLDNSVSAGGTANFFRTGYLTLAQERNPWVGPDAPEGNYQGVCQDFDERPYSDSVPDFFIVHLGSGI